MIEKDGQWGKYWSHKTTDQNYPKGYCNGKVPKPNDQELLAKILTGQEEIKDLLLSLGARKPVKPSVNTKPLPF